MASGPRSTVTELQARTCVHDEEMTQGKGGNGIKIALGLVGCVCRRGVGTFPWTKTRLETLSLSPGSLVVDLRAWSQLIGNEYPYRRRRRQL